MTNAFREKSRLFQRPAREFVPQNAVNGPALFFQTAEDLITDRSINITLTDGGKAFLRLYPTRSVPPITTELDAKELIIQGQLAPLGRVISGYGYERNMFGAICFEAPEGNLYHCSQLFLNREIWGIDARMVNKEWMTEVQKQFGHPAFAYIPNSYVEEVFAKALLNYLAFAKQHLHLPLPLRMHVGLTGVRGLPIAVDNSGNFAGRALRDIVELESEIDSYDKPVSEILGPFLDRVWANCDLRRTAQHHAAFVRKWSRAPEQKGTRSIL